MRLPSRIAAIAILAVSASGLEMFAQEPPPVIKNDPKIVEKIKGDFLLRGGTVDGNKMTADRVADVSVKITDQNNHHVRWSAPSNASAQLTSC